MSLNVELAVLVISWTFIVLVLCTVLLNLYLYLDWRRWADRSFGLGAPGFLVGAMLYDHFIPWTTPIQLVAFAGFVLSALLFFGGAFRPAHSPPRR